MATLHYRTDWYSYAEVDMATSPEMTGQGLVHRHAVTAPLGQSPHLLFYDGQEEISGGVICMDEIFAQELEDGPLDNCISHEDNNSQKVTTGWHHKDQTALVQSPLAMKAMPNTTIQKPLIEEKARGKSKVTAGAWMTITLNLCSLLADEEHVLSKVTRKCNAKDIQLDEQTRSQEFYTVMGAAIVKDLARPIVKVRPVFLFLQERNPH